LAVWITSVVSDCASTFQLSRYISRF